MINAIETPDGLSAAARSLADNTIRGSVLRSFAGCAVTPYDDRRARLRKGVLDICNAITFRPMLTVYAVGLVHGKRPSLGRVKTAMDARRLARETAATVFTIVLVAQEAARPFIEIRAGAAVEIFDDSDLDRRLPALGWG